MNRLHPVAAALAALALASPLSAQLPALRPVPAGAVAPAVLPRREAVRLPAPAALPAGSVDRRGVHRWGALSVVDPEMAGAVLRMAARSPSFRGALERLSRSRVPVLVGTPGQLAPRVPRFARRSSLLATTVAVPRPGARIHPGSDRPVALQRVLVVVDRDAFRDAYAAAGTLAALEQDLEVVLAHELAGHARAWGESGDLRRGCMDPETAEVLLGSDEKGCAVEHENAVRRELGVVERPSYRVMPLVSGQAWGRLEEAHQQRRAQGRGRKRLVA